MNGSSSRPPSYANVAGPEKKPRSSFGGKCRADHSRGAVHQSQDILKTYWTNVFTQPATNTKPQCVQRSPIEDVWQLITPENIRAGRPFLAVLPGPDGFTARQLGAIQPGVLTRICNLILWCGKLPEHLAISRTIFIPKKPGAKLAWRLSTNLHFLCIHQTYTQSLSTEDRSTHSARRASTSGPGWDRWLQGQHRPSRRHSSESVHQFPLAVHRHARHCQGLWQCGPHRPPGCRRSSRSSSRDDLVSPRLLPAKHHHATRLRMGIWATLSHERSKSGRSALAGHLQRHHGPSSLFSLQ